MIKQKKNPKSNKVQFSNLELKLIKPLTHNQEKVFNEYNSEKHILNIGISGTGKSFVLTYLALKDILSFKNQYEKLIIVRSIVPTRDIGFLKGSEIEKQEVYEAPYRYIINKLFGRGDAYEILKQKNIIEFTSTSFLRSLTWDNCIVLIDEAQNMTENELLSLFTRVGYSCRLIISGDDKLQCDLNLKKEESGIQKYKRICENMKEFGIIEYQFQDIVRSDFIKSFYIALYGVENRGM